MKYVLMLIVGILLGGGAAIYFLGVPSAKSAPGQAVRMLVFDIYTNGFQFFRFGYAAAEAVTLTLIVLGLTVIQFSLARNDLTREK